MESNQLYLMQLTRRTKQTIDELKSLNNRLRNENIEIAEFQQIVRQLDRLPQLVEQAIRKQQAEKEAKERGNIKEKEQYIRKQIR